MLKKLFEKFSSVETMETMIVPDSDWLGHYCSYEAVKSWWGGWHVYLCTYVTPRLRHEYDSAVNPGKKATVFPVTVSLPALRGGSRCQKNDAGKELLQGRCDMSFLSFAFGRSAASQEMETYRAPAQRGQSRDLVSYKAVRNWRGKWNIFFCNYQPLDKFPPAEALRLEKQGKVFSQRAWWGREEVFAPHGKAEPCLKGAGFQQAVDYLKKAENSWNLADEDKIPHPAHYSRYSRARPASGLKPG